MYTSESYQSTLEQVPTKEEIALLVQQVYKQVFRTDFKAPGFALISFRQAVDSATLRHFMVAFKEALALVYRQTQNRHLSSLSMMHFDQQNTTKFHLDGAPAESYLMLGYESSDVRSSLRMADYTRAAHGLNLTPRQFLADHNPMFARGERMLTEYTTRLEGFDTRQAHILLINNSSLPISSNGTNTLGVMHQATISAPDSTKRRVIHSIMLAGSEAEDDPAGLVALQQDFLTGSPPDTRTDHRVSGLGRIGSLIGSKMGGFFCPVNMERC